MEKKVVQFSVDEGTSRLFLKSPNLESVSTGIWWNGGDCGVETMDSQYEGWEEVEDSEILNSRYGEY